MTHPIIAKLNDVEADLAHLPDSVPGWLRAAAGAHIQDIRRQLTDHLGGDPAPGSTTQVAGATITHRPDLAYDERARQAAAQGGVDRGMYAPLREALANETTVQRPAADRPAELAKVGGEVR